MVVAALLRAGYLTEIEHNVDHAYPIWQALMTLDRGMFPLAGQGTSVLFANPALTGYLYVPFVALARSPLAVYVFVVALNTLAVLLAYRAVRALLGPRPALIAAGLMAVNPWLVEYSRAAWVQSLLPFFASAVAWLLWPLLLGRSRRPVRRTVLALLLLTLMTQTYLLAFGLLLPVGALLIAFRRRVPRRGLLIGGAIFLAATALYGAGLLAQWDTVQQRLADFSSGPPRLSLDAWNHAVRLISGADYPLLRGQHAPIADFALRQDLTQVAHGALLVALLVGIGLAAWAVVSAFRRRGFKSSAQNEKSTEVDWDQHTADDGAERRYESKKTDRDRRAAPNDESTSVDFSSLAGDLNPRRFRGGVIALLWFGLPILMMSYVGQVVHPFYQVIGLPAGYALAAWGLSAICRPAATRWGGALLLMLAIPFAVLMGLNSARFAQETTATPGVDDLGALPLDFGLRLGSVISDHLPENGVVFADVDTWTLNSLAGRLFPVIRDTRAPAFTLIPREGGLYVTAVPPADPILVPPYAAPVETLTLPDGWRLAVAAFAPAATRFGPNRVPLDCPSPLDAPSEQGITLLCHDLHEDGGAWTLTTTWRVDTPAPYINERLFAPFTHVFDADGGRVLIVDGAAVPGYEWRAGDLHLHQMTFTLPEDAPPPFTLRVGQYDALHDENVIFILPGGEYTPLIALPETLVE